MSESSPEKYKIEPGGKTAYGEAADKLVNQETGEWFFLTNRSFEEINHSFAKLPSRALAQLKKQSDEQEPIRVLDIGVGIEARAAENIAEEHGGKEDERVQVFSLDLTARKKNREGLHQVVGDALNLPIKDNSIDMAYSRMSVSLIKENDPSTLRQALKEAARALKPGGIFFLDKIYTEKLGRVPNTAEMSNLAEELGVAFYTKELGLFVGSFERLCMKLNGEYPDWKFIIMIRKPIDEEMLNALKLRNEDKL